MSDKSKFYDSYSQMDKLSHGNEIRLHHSIHFRDDRADLAPLVSAGLEQLVKLREASMEAEESLFEKLKVSMLQWEQQGALTMIVNRAIEYLETPNKSHTSNKWTRVSSYDDREEISNRVYKMSVGIDERATYNRQTQQLETSAWYISWSIRTNNPGRYYATIAGQEKKKFTDKAVAMKYIEGRKKAYAHLFTEISPPIPQKYAEEFKINGLLLPGYTVENQEPQLTKHTTMCEILESMGVDIDMSADQKSSVLEKLSEAKRNAKEIEKNTLPKEKSHPKERKDI